MKIEHLAIWVTNLAQMKKFYQTYFQATAGEKYHNPKKQFESYFLSFAGGARLELMRREDISPRKNDIHSESIGLAHVAFSVGSKEKVNSLTEQLRKDGYVVFDGPRTTGDGYYESVVLDPEGNRIKITI
jgi:lactoylglutathione lyase